MYNAGLTTTEKIAHINKQNIVLLNDFLDYLKSIARAETTIKNYKADLLIFFCWCEEYLDNKYFVNLTKREIARFQNQAINEWHWGANRIRTVKAAISSLSNFIENILDDEIEGYKSIVRKIESPPKVTVREKTVYSEEEITHLLDELVKRKEYDRACFVALGAYSGRRKSELLRFRVDDFGDDKLVCDGALYRSAPIKQRVVVAESLLLAIPLRKSSNRILIYGSIIAKNMVLRANGFSQRKTSRISKWQHRQLMAGQMSLLKSLEKIFIIIVFDIE